MVTPDDETQYGDRDHRIHHHAIAEDRFAAERREDIGGHSHRRQNHDVNFRMTEEPEQMLPQQRMSARMFERFAVQIIRPE